jgi:hypothetical protein
VSRIMDLNVIRYTADLASVGIKIKGKGFMKPKINLIITYTIFSSNLHNKLYKTC